MKKKFVAFALCLLSVAGCASQQLAAAASSAEDSYFFDSKYSS